MVDGPPGLMAARRLCEDRKAARTRTRLKLSVERESERLGGLADCEMVSVGCRRRAGAAVGSSESSAQNPARLTSDELGGGQADSDHFCFNLSYSLTSLPSCDGTSGDTLPASTHQIALQHTHILLLAVPLLLGREMSPLGRPAPHRRDQQGIASNLNDLEPSSTQ